MEKLFLRMPFEALRDKTHVQFVDSLQTLIEAKGAGALGITALFNDLKSTFAKETAILEPRISSNITLLLIDKDKRRRDVYKGFLKTVEGSCRHYDPELQEAGTFIYAALKHHGAVYNLPYIDETAAIKDIVRELSTPANAALVTKLNFNGWVTYIEQVNNEFQDLLLQRTQEITDRPKGDMRTIRREVDSIMRKMVDRIEIACSSTPSLLDDMLPFIELYNTLVTQYKKILAQEKGRRYTKSKNKEDNELVDEGTQTGEESSPDDGMVSE
jgi:hypothetical protein